MLKLPKLSYLANNNSPITSRTSNTTMGKAQDAFATEQSEITKFKELNEDTFYKVSNESPMESQYGPSMILTMTPLDEELEVIATPIQIFVNPKILTNQKARSGVDGKDYYLHYIGPKKAKKGGNSYYDFKVVAIDQPKSSNKNKSAKGKKEVIDDEEKTPKKSHEHKHKKTED